MIQCPFCSTDGAGVVQTIGDIRIRKCVSCKKRFKTKETVYIEINSRPPRTPRKDEGRFKQSRVLSDMSALPYRGSWTSLCENETPIFPETKTHYDETGLDNLSGIEYTCLYP